MDCTELCGHLLHNNGHDGSLLPLFYNHGLLEWQYARAVPKLRSRRAAPGSPLVRISSLVVLGLNWVGDVVATQQPQSCFYHQHPSSNAPEPSLVGSYIFLAHFSDLDPICLSGKRKNYCAGARAQVALSSNHNSCPAV